MKTLAKHIENLNQNINFHDISNPIVSTSTIAWQIDHSLKVIIGVIATLKKTKPEKYKPSFNYKRSIVLLIGKIPRGKANAPESVRNYEKIEIEDLKSQIEIAKNSILELENLNPKNHFIHPFFGILNLKQTIRFLNIHTYHHIKIINDILLSK